MSEINGRPDPLQGDGDPLNWLKVAKERDRGESLVTFSHRTLQKIIDAVERLRLIEADYISGEEGEDGPRPQREPGCANPFLSLKGANRGEASTTFTGDDSRDMAMPLPPVDDGTTIDGSQYHIGYVTPDGHLEVRDRGDGAGIFHETEIGQYDRWLRQAPDLYGRLVEIQIELFEAGKRISELEKIESDYFTEICESCGHPWRYHTSGGMCQGTHKGIECHCFMIPEVRQP